MQVMTTPGESARADDMELLDRYWRAANYLSVGQIYLLDNPLLKEPLKSGHIKPRLLRHWGTPPDAANAASTPPGYRTTDAQILCR
jgi:xylulose-5-phosphate/fructose-6-phosphate phosphoketolase